LKQGCGAVRVKLNWQGKARDSENDNVTEDKQRKGDAAYTQAFMARKEDKNGETADTQHLTEKDTKTQMAVTKNREMPHVRTWIPMESAKERSWAHSSCTRTHALDRPRCSGEEGVDASRPAVMALWATRHPTWNTDTRPVATAPTRWGARSNRGCGARGGKR
jgi:hypothetical protein